MRRSLTLIIGLALVAAACGLQDVTEETSTTVTATTTTEPITTGGEADSQTSTVSIDSSATAWVRHEWSPPADMEPHAAAWGDPGMVVLGYSSLDFDDSPTANGLWLFDGETWSGTMLSDVTTGDEYGFIPTVTDLVWFGGRYLAFLMGDTTTTAGRASMLTSQNGLDWELEYLGSAPAVATPAGLYATPESPPWPGTSAVARVAVHHNEITAAGWTVLGANEGFLSMPVIWRSTNGRTWSTKALPNANFQNEWARDVAVGPLGYLVEIGGPVHQSASLWYSPNGEDWTYVGDRFDDQWRMLVSISVGKESMLAVLMDLADDGGQPLELWRSTNGLDWEEVEPPFSHVASLDGYPPADLANTRQGIVALVAGENATDLWRSRDGLSWNQLPSIVSPEASGHARIVPALPFPFSTGEGLSLVAAVPGTVVRWTEATETRSIVTDTPEYGRWLPSDAMNAEPAFEADAPGCGLAAAGAAALLGLAALGFWIGFFVLDPPNYLLVFSALPVSALFTVLGALFSSTSSDFLLAWPVDFGLWLAVAFVVSRWATRKGLNLRAYAAVFLLVVVIALVYGAALSLLVEPVA